MKTALHPAAWILGACLALGAAGCSQGDTQESTAADETAETHHKANVIDTDRTIPVAVTPLESGHAAEVIKVWGAVQAWQEARLLAGVGGTVTERRARLGQTVAKDAVILAVDPELHKARVAEAEARLAGAEVSMRMAQRNLERAQKLHGDEKISDVELEQATVDHANAQAQEAAARAGLEQARITYRDARPTAPFRGVVANQLPNAGTSVNAGELLVHLVDLDRVKVLAEVSEQDLLRIEAGGTATLEVQGLDRTFEGTVRGLGPQADATSRQFPVEIEVDNPGHLLRAGMVARVNVVIEEYDDVPLLPVACLVERDGELGFFALKGETAEWRDAVFGPRTNTHVAVLDGARAGESIVTMGQNRLQDGAKVRVEEAP